MSKWRQSVQLLSICQCCDCTQLSEDNICKLINKKINNPEESIPDICPFPKESTKRAKHIEKSIKKILLTQ